MIRQCDQCGVTILVDSGIRLEGWETGHALGMVSVQVLVCSPECKKARQVRAHLETPQIVGLDEGTRTASEFLDHFRRA